MKLFNLDSPFMSFMTKLADLMLLNLLWLVCCLPIITIGAATAAMYYCLLNQDRVSSVVGTFFSAFKSNFKKATLLWLIQAVMITVAAFDLLYFFGVWADAGLAVRVICLIPAAWLLMGAGYLFPLQAQFENTVGNTLKNAILISIANLPVSLVVTVLNLLPVLFFFFNMELFLRTAIIWVLIGGAAIAYLNTGFLKKVFRRYMPEQEQEDGAAQSEE
ncbi:MAG: YesL family protein [Faecousia sp.]